MPLRLLPLGLVAVLLAVPAGAQGDRSLYNQDRLAELLYANRTDLDAIPEVTYRYHTLSHESGNSVLARHALYGEVGEGDPHRGRDLLNGMVAFLNGVFISDLRHGDTVVLPSEIGLDPRAYSPFPRDYPGARDFDKLFVIDKTTQSWAGYENGRLARWGLVSTGAEGTETPNGRFNFNWKEEHRISTLSPPGEEWHMRWVFNFHDRRGIHIHQYYALPTSGAASHGCVRLMTADAQWIYDWADGWRTSNGTADRGLASRGRVVEQGTTVLVLGEAPGGAPQRFRDVGGRPELVTVELPADPYAVPPGTDQQRRFDRLRAREAAEASAAAES
jgi:hypothetical protein